ncbi:hypothetical protein TNCV_2017911 [Trichonephila clavipes]|nr:hypothetical protein TNCV_2017911 [Trichonephila clavipes]
MTLLATPTSATVLCVRPVSKTWISVDHVVVTFSGHLFSKQQPKGRRDNEKQQLLLNEDFCTFSGHER